VLVEYFVPKTVLVPFERLTKTTRSHLLLSILLLPAIMETAFFVPTTRMRALLLADRPLYDRIQDPIMRACCPTLLPDTFQEVTMLEYVRNGTGTFESEFYVLRSRFTFNNFFELARRKIVWVGPNLFFKAKGAVVDIAALLVIDPPIFSIKLRNNVDPGGEYVLEAYCLPRTNTATAICGHIFEFMTAFNPTWTLLEFNRLTLHSIPKLRQFLSSPDDTNGGNICFPENDLADLNENFLLVIRNNARQIHTLELKIGTMDLDWQDFDNQRRLMAITHFFQYCQCAVILFCGAFRVSDYIISDALRRGDSRIVDLVLDEVPNVDGDIDELVRALGNNNSLLRLTIANILISEDQWTILCRSLSVHPTLEYLRLLRTFPHDPPETSDQRKDTRTDLFVVMLDANTVLQELDARGGTDRTQDEFVEGTLSEVIQPLLRGRRAIRAIPIE
jgi:hypothetical protein